MAGILREEINKFNACKAELSYVPLNLTINRNLYMLQMPAFIKLEIRQVVNAFSLLILDKVEKDKTLTKSEIDEITEKFDNFLIILKLLSDDNNVCKQNFSNYHITQFKRALDEYRIYFK